MSPYSDVTSSIHTVFNFPRARPLRASSQSNLARRPARSLGKTAWWIGEGKPGDKVESISAMIMDYILWFLVEVKIVLKEMHMNHLVSDLISSTLVQYDESLKPRLETVPIQKLNYKIDLRYKIILFLAKTWGMFISKNHYVHGTYDYNSILWIRKRWAYFDKLFQRCRDHCTYNFCLKLNR